MLREYEITAIWVRSNRTFMELKLGETKSGLSGQPSSNRTFMELKLLRDLKMLLLLNCSNRTFMELKCIRVK